MPQNEINKNQQVDTLSVLNMHTLILSLFQCLIIEIFFLILGLMSNNFTRPEPNGFW